MHECESQIFEEGVRIFKGYGVDDLTARILSILNFEHEDISMEELAARTGYSLASISLKMKHIESFWGIQRIGRPGSRKVYFRMEKDLLDAFVLQLELGYGSEVSIAKERIFPLIDGYREAATSPDELERLKAFENYQLQVKELEELLSFIYLKVEEMRSDRMGRHVQVR